MSRHRNVRSMNYSDEYDGYDDVYGHSVEDDYTISPSDAAFMYDRNRQPQMSAFLAEEDDIAEEDETAADSTDPGTARRDSETYHRPTLSEIDEARLRSCLDEIRNVIGDSITERILVDAVLKYDFNVNKSLDAILSSAATTAQIEDSQSKRLRERKDLGKDLDDNTAPLRQLLKQNVMPSITNNPLLAFQSSVATAPVNPNSVSDLGDELAKKLKTGPNQPLKLPKFQFKAKPLHSLNTEDSSDDEEGSLSSLMAQHQKSTIMPGSKFSSLADLADQHFKIKPLSLKTSPSLFKNSQFSGSISAVRLNPDDQIGNVINSFDTSEQSLPKPNDDDVQIDLSCALKPAASRKSKSEEMDVDRKVHFETQFVDEGVLERLTTLHLVEEFDCAGNARDICNRKVARRKVLSSFGKVVCRRWKQPGCTPTIPPKSDVLNNIPRFDFHAPSPDDIVLRHLRKK